MDSARNSFMSWFLLWTSQRVICLWNGLHWSSCSFYFFVYFITVVMLTFHLNCKLLAKIWLVLPCYFRFCISAVLPTHTHTHTHNSDEAWCAWCLLQKCHMCSVIVDSFSVRWELCVKMFAKCVCVWTSVKSKSERKTSECD